MKTRRLGRLRPPGLRLLDYYLNANWTVSSKKRYDSTPHLISNHACPPRTSKLIAQYSVLHEFAVGACSRDDASVAKFHR
jgi:hypothetical protein